MTLLTFNEAALVEELDSLSVPLRAVFAAGIAERLAPAYAIFTRLTGRGDPGTLAAILERLWLDIEGTQRNTRQDEDIELCMALIPREDSDDFWVPEQVYAEDAAMALAYALRSVKSGAAQEAAWAAQAAYEAVDHFVIEQEGIDTNHTGAE